MSRKERSVADLKATIASKKAFKADLERSAFALFVDKIDALQSIIDELEAELARLEKES